MLSALPPHDERTDVLDIRRNRGRIEKFGKKYILDFACMSSEKGRGSSRAYIELELYSEGEIEGENRANKAANSSIRGAHLTFKSF